MKRKWSLYIFAIICSLFAFNFVYAEEIQDLSKMDPSKRYMLEKTAAASNVDTKINTVTVNGALATINAQGTHPSFYYAYNTVAQQPGSNISLNSSANTYYIGVKNGYYYFWISGAGSYLGLIPYANNPVHVTSSCNNESIRGLTGTATFERCFVSEYGSDWKIDGTSNDSVVTCADGYETSEDLITLVENTCSYTEKSVRGQTLPKAYCRRKYQVTCKSTAQSAPAPTLTSLSVSNGSLSPAFNPATKKYSVSVGSDVSKITIDATASEGAIFKQNYGPKTYNLSYGTNSIKIIVVNAANVQETYVINVTRQDNRNANNKLSSLSVDQGLLSPGFSADTTTYSLTVPGEVTSLKVDAVLADATSSFDQDFGPRTVTLNGEVTEVLVKVRSQKGTVNVYTINVTKGELTTCTTELDEKALLSKVEFVNTIDGSVIDALEIVKGAYTYNVKVPNEVVNVTINAFPVTEGDTFSVLPVTNLEIGIEQEATIVVNSSVCAGVSKTYTIGITRADVYEFSDNAKIKNLTIKNHSKFEFDPDTTEYELRLNKKEKELDISYITEDDNTVCNIIGNSNLKEGSEVFIECTAEDEVSVQIYKIKMIAAKKGTPVWLVVIVIIIILLVLAYLVLRLMGYKIYFNPASIGEMFSGLFNKNK